jgi:RimJ/RimL family protein N-acetyltransferase
VSDPDTPDSPEPPPFADTAAATAGGTSDHRAPSLAGTAPVHQGDGGPTSHQQCEVGYRIARPFQDQRYAPEAARAAFRFGFENLRRQEIVANASADNAKSHSGRSAGYSAAAPPP